MNIDSVKISDNLSVINALNTKIYYEDSDGVVKMIMPNNDIRELSEIEFETFSENNINFNSMKLSEKFHKLLEDFYDNYEDSLLVILPLDKMLLSYKSTCSLGKPIKKDNKGRVIQNLNNLYIR